MGTPLFGCRNEHCAPEVSYPAADLREHPDGGPICENCWDDEPPVWLDGNNGDDGGDWLRWCDLPKFVPEHEKRIATLEARLAAAEADAERLEWMAWEGYFIWTRPGEDDELEYCVCDIVDMTEGGELTPYFRTWREAIDAARTNNQTS